MTAVCSHCGQPVPDDIGVKDGWLRVGEKRISLTPTERRVLELALEGRFTRSQMTDRVYAHRDDGGPLCAESVVSIMISRLDEKLVPLGFAISARRTKRPYHAPVTLVRLPAGAAA